MAGHVADCYDKSMDVRQARLENFLTLLAEYDSKKAFADVFDTAPAYVSQIYNRTRKLGDELPPRIERIRGLPPGWMDHPHTELHPRAGADAETAIGITTQASAEIQNPPAQTAWFPAFCKPRSPRT